MAVRTEKSLIYHIPKCGGIWVKEVVRHSGIRYWRCRTNTYREPWGLLREHCAPSTLLEDDKDGLFAFCFVRHPVEWYRSFWCFRMMGLRRGGSLAPRFPADKSWDDDPEQFARNLMEDWPDGFVSQLYQRYVHDCDYVGHQETLREDLIQALTLAGEEFDENVALTLGRFNRVASKPEWREECAYGPELRKEIETVEAWTMENFYV